MIVSTQVTTMLRYESKDVKHDDHQQTNGQTKKQISLVCYVMDVMCQQAINH